MMPTDHLPATVAVAVSRRVLPWKKTKEEGENVGTKELEGNQQIHAHVGPLVSL